MAYFKLKRFINISAFLLLGLTTVSIKAQETKKIAKIRKYNYRTDYQAARYLCRQQWEFLAEADSTCTGQFDTFLLAFSDTPSTTVRASGSGLKSKVILKDKKIMGIAFYAYPIPAHDWLMKRSFVNDNSYAELTVILIDKNAHSSYKNPLFNSCKSEFLKSQEIKTVLARVVRSNRAYKAWLELQGFVPLNPVTASTPFEEAYRLDSEAAKQDSFKLELEPRSNVEWGDWKRHFLEDAEEFQISVQRNILSDLAQSKSAHILAEGTAHITEFTYDQRQSIARLYLRVGDRQKTSKIVAYTFGLTSITREMEQSMERLFDYVDANLPALEDLFNSPQYLQKLLDEIGNILH